MIICLIDNNMISFNYSNRHMTGQWKELPDFLVSLFGLSNNLTSVGRYTLLPLL